VRVPGKWRAGDSMLLNLMYDAAMLLPSTILNTALIALCGLSFSLSLASYSLLYSTILLYYRYSLFVEVILQALI
jgi:hypothetical protein